MTRIGSRFADLRRRNEKGLIVYLTAGDPNLSETADLVLEAEQAGADLVELGVPWSDPSSDGPIIQRAMERAVAGGTTLAGSLGVVAELRRRSELPLVLFGYYNPIFTMGTEVVTDQAVAVGIDGLLVVDLPLEEADELDRPLVARGIDRIPLIAPTTSVERARRHAARGSGFAYYVSITGVTGAAHLDVDAVQTRVAELRPALGALPVAVGFGVRDAESARAVSAFADAVVVGSALVQAIETARDAAGRRAAVSQVVGQLKRAVNSS